MRALVAMLWALSMTPLVSGCSFSGRMHLGDVWLSAGQGFTMVGNHVAIALH